jgi:phospholipid transport system substrate-binding protein
MKSLFAFFSGLLIAMSAMAQEVAPDALIKSVTNEVLDIVRKDKDIQSGNTKKAIELVEAKVLPHFNFTRMTQLALARDWRQANAAQQKTLTDEFRHLLVRTYSKALTEYKNQTIDFKPFAAKAGETDVRVRTEIKQSGAGKNIELDYFLEKSAGGWKVYDIEVGGISLVTNYRTPLRRKFATTASTA